MSLSLQIVDASVENVADISYIQTQTWLDSYVNKKEGILREDIEAKIDEWNKVGEKRVLEELVKPGAHTWVAKEGEEVIGFVGVVKGEEESTLEAWHVLPKYQGLGIGKALLDKAMEYLGNSEVRLEVVAYNKKAQEIYKNMDLWW